MGRAINTVVVIIYLKNILVLTGILLAIASQSGVMAAQPVIFKVPTDLPSPPALMKFIAANENFTNTDISIAAIDLNNDFINEYIVRSTQCSPAEGCSYLIIADNNEDYMTIGQFSGKNISLADQQTHGIRDILVYNQRLNDYAHTTLKWDTRKMQYSFNQEQARVN